MKSVTWIKHNARQGLFISALMLTVFAVAAARTSADKRELKFSHAFHVVENGLDCATCHNQAERSSTGLDDLLPGHPECADCHDVQAASGCGTCHTSATPALSPRVRNYSERFSHQLHVDQAKLECAACHRDLDKPVLPENVGHFPTMGECMTCHEQRGASLECAACHTPDDPRIPKDHLVNWLHSHGTAATTLAEKSCAQCHGREDAQGNIITDCQSCHTGDKVFTPHPPNYISRHGQDAHMSDLRCATCHETQNDCNACHRQFNVLPSGHFRPGWVTPGGGKHSEQAKFDLESCASCHDSPRQEPTCARCHGK